MDAIVNIDKSFGEFAVHANIGTSFEDSRSKNVGLGGQLKSAPNAFYKENIYQPGSLGSDWREQAQSIFASAEVSWRSMIYLTLTGRNEWNSTLSGMPQKSFFYPSVGLSGIVTEMLPMPKAVTFLKVRGSWADVGGGIPRQLTARRYDYKDQLPQLFVHVTYMPLTSLYPERTRSWELGMESRFFNNLLRLDLTLYRTNSFNQTLSTPVSSSSGYDKMYVQTGDVQNKGFEVLLGVQKKWNKFGWNPSITASYNHNRINDLGKAIDPETGAEIIFDKINKQDLGSLQIRLTEGGTMGDLWSLRDLQTDMNGNVWVDELGNINTMDKEKKVGTTLPTWKLGFNNSFSWNNIHLNLLFSARLGGQVFSRTQAVLDSYGVSKASADLRDAGGKLVNNGKISAETWYKTIGGKQGVYQFYVYDADNVRLQEVSIGYTLPKAWFKGVGNLHVSLVGRNLLMIYNKAPFDPETTASTNEYYQGIDYFMQPSTRTLGFSVKMDF
jgi:outer membrane receptor protein involved in Fe transport